MKFLLPALAIVLAALVAACASSDAPSGQVSTSTEIPPTSTPTIVPTPTPGAGEDQTLEGELVPDWPADFPVPEGATVVRSSRTTDAAGLVTINSLFQVNLTVGEAGDFYSETFGVDPWRVGLEQVEDDSAIFQFTNSEADNQNGTVSIQPALDAEGVVVVNVILTSGDLSALPTPGGTPSETPPEEGTETPEATASATPEP